MRSFLCLLAIAVSLPDVARAGDDPFVASTPAYEGLAYLSGEAYSNGLIHPPTPNANGIVPTEVAYPFYRGFYSYNRFYGYRTWGDPAQYRPNYTRGLQDGYWLPAGRRWGAH